MQIDIATEHIIPLREAQKHCPGHPNMSAFYRWMKRSENPLETLIVGGRRFTSIEAIHRFIERCTDQGMCSTGAKP